MPSIQLQLLPDWKLVGHLRGNVVPLTRLPLVTRGKHRTTAVWWGAMSRACPSGYLRVAHRLSCAQSLFQCPGKRLVCYFGYFESRAKPLLGSGGSTTLCTQMIASSSLSTANLPLLNPWARSLPLSAPSWLTPCSDHQFPNNLGYAKKRISLCCNLYVTNKGCCFF